jgi:MinD superfamily P-loop ATPase
LSKEDKIKRAVVRVDSDMIAEVDFVCHGCGFCE